MAGMICALAVGMKYKLGFDDSLDVVGVHLVGGIVGALMIGFIGTKRVNADSLNGLFYGGGFHLLRLQALAVVSVLAYSFVCAYIIGWVIHKTIGFRVSEEDEISGIDLAEHAESAYDLFAGAASGLGARMGTSRNDEEVTA